MHHRAFRRGALKGARLTAQLLEPCDLLLPGKTRFTPDFLELRKRLVSTRQKRKLKRIVPVPGGNAMVSESVIKHG